MDIGPLPPVKDPERRSACEQDLALYLKTYHAPAFPLPWSDAHRVCLERAQIVVMVGALFALAMPRGTGKSTTCRHTVQWATNYGHRRFTYLIGANDDKGQEALDLIQLDYETNTVLLEDFPEICYPLAQLDGIHNRAKAQTLDGVRTRIQFRKRTLILPTVAGSAAAGAVIKAGGLMSALRGASHRLPDGTIIRPDLLLLDDPQTRESAESPDQSATRTRIITADVLGMAGPGGEIAALMPCTVIAPGDMADCVLDRDKHPEWRGLRTQMLATFPERLDLWEEYWDIFCQALKDDDPDGVPKAATAYYAANRQEMDKGAVATWPERHRRDELSAIQNAMNLFLRDEAAFFSEYQNEPQNPFADEQFLSAKDIAAKVNGLARGQVPLGVDWLTLFVDCHKRALYWMVCGFEWDFTGYLIDYGVFPKQNRATFKVQRARPTLQEVFRGRGESGALYAGLEQLVSGLLAEHWKREDGVDLQISKGLIDTGYESSTIRKCIRQSGWSGVIFPAFGRTVSESEVPISRYKKRAGELIGQEWLIRGGKGHLRHAIIDVWWWKTFAHRRLAAAMGDPGCFSLFGREPGGRKANHDFLASHLDSERRTTQHSERTVDHWDLKPGSENHWFDCFVGCHAAASMAGAQTTPVRDLVQKVAKKTLSERRAEKRQRRGG